MRYAALLLVILVSISMAGQDVPNVITEDIVLACGASCTDDAPATASDLPRCGDYELNSALIESSERGDASSIALLRSRYETADTYGERHRIAAALLRTPADAKFWDELVADAEIAVRFPHIDEELSRQYLEWCAERQVAPEEHWYVGLDALERAAHDRRARPLLLRALATNDNSLVLIAIEALGKQRDFDSLPLIEKAIARVPEQSAMLAVYLAQFGDERADAIAMKYLDESDLATYREWRSAADDPRADPQ
ncbi:MAG: hypothetical protein ACJ74H_19415 [Thermoanaerobaculia bacterium]